MPRTTLSMFTPVRKVIKRDYFGNLYETVVVGHPDVDYSKLWKEFSERFVNRNDTGQYASIGNRLAEHGEVVLREREGAV